MTKIIHSNNCKNSPKNKMIEDLTISFELGNVNPEILNKNTVWKRYNKDHIVGITNIIEKAKEAEPPTQITIENAISHGKIGAATGIRHFGTSNTQFFYFFEFTSVTFSKIAIIKST